MRLPKPSAAMLVAILALCVALGGSSYAALQLPKDSVGSKQLKRNSVNSSKVKPGSLLLSDFRQTQLAALRGGRGPQGAAGAQGAKGDPGAAGAQGARGDPGAPGAPATRLFAEISSGATPTVLYGQGVTEVTNAGTFYVLTFNRDISQCAPLGTTTGTNGNNVDSRINVVHRAGGPTQLNVRTYTGASENAVTNIPFSIAVFCP